MWDGKRARTVFEGWNSLSLVRQFLFAGIAVSLLAMICVGALVANLIERSVIRHAAATTALYVDSVIAPLLPDMRTTNELDDVVSHSLDETLGSGKLGERLVSFRIWRKDGTIVYANRKDLIGEKVPPSPDLLRAFSGEVVAEYGEATDQESTFERSLGVPLLEIYSPILQPWTGEVVGVSEFYEKVPDFASGLYWSRATGWAAVAAITMGLFGSLFTIVLRGSSTIEAQRIALKVRVEELAQLAQRNEALATSVLTASDRATAFNERFLRRLGADLHDGPAQHVAFAALRLGSRAVRGKSVSTAARDKELSIIKASLAEAMDEIRIISGALALPHIDTADLHEVINAAVNAHEKRTKAKIKLLLSDQIPLLDSVTKICVFRFVQEALSNSARHAGSKGVSVSQTYEQGTLAIAVEDRGAGFDTSSIPRERLGLACLRLRVESLGGTAQIRSSPKGTVVSMTMQISDGKSEAAWAA